MNKSPAAPLKRLCNRQLRGAAGRGMIQTRQQAVHGVERRHAALPAMGSRQSAAGNNDPTTGLYRFWAAAATTYLKPVTLVIQAGDVKPLPVLPFTSITGQAARVRGRHHAVCSGSQR